MVKGIDWGFMLIVSFQAALPESTPRCLPWQDLSSLVLFGPQYDKVLPRHKQIGIVSWSVSSDDKHLITEFIVSLCLHNWESVRIWASMFYLHRNKGIFPSIVYKMIQAIHSYHIIFDEFSAHLCYRSCSSDILNGWFLIIFPTASD